MRGSTSRAARLPVAVPPAAYGPRVSSVLHPVGPERRGTYWRRRLVLVVVLVVLVVLAVLGIRALAGGTADPGAATTTLDPDQVSPAPVTTSGTATAGPTDSPTGTPTDGATGATSAAATGPCDASALNVVLTTDAPSYGPAGAPKFVVTVYNTSASTCSTEIGSAERTFSVTDATGAVVWRSNDCQTETASQVYEIAPEDHQAMSTTWSRQRSEAGCPPEQKRVDPGAYTVNATWKDVTAPPVQFSITG